MVTHPVAGFDSHPFGLARNVLSENSSACHPS